MSKLHASSLETVFKSYLAACLKFAFSLSSRGKGLNFITTVSLHPVCLSEFPLVAVSIYFQRRQWHPAPVLLPGKSHGRRRLVGYSPWDCEESDTAERLPFHFSLPCIGEGNGNPLQGSCLENLRDGGAWWAAVYGVAQSRTRLKRLSSSQYGSH